MLSFEIPAYSAASGTGMYRRFPGLYFCCSSSVSNLVSMRLRFGIDCSPLVFSTHVAFWTTARITCKMRQSATFLQVGHLATGANLLCAWFSCPERFARLFEWSESFRAEGHPAITEVNCPFDTLELHGGVEILLNALCTARPPDCPQMRISWVTWGPDGPDHSFSVDILPIPELMPCPFEVGPLSSWS